MRTKQSYINEVIAAIDARMGESYTANLHDTVVQGLCDLHRRELAAEIPSEGGMPATLLAETLMRAAAGVSTIPTASIWQVDGDLKERFIAVYSSFVYTMVSNRGFDPHAGFLPGDTRFEAMDPYAN